MKQWKVAYAAGVPVAAAVGMLMGVLSVRTAQADYWGWEAVDTHWHAGVWEWTDTAWWCFGLLGWHSDSLSGSNRAADVFADASDPSCYGPTSTEVRLHVSGYRPSGAAPAVMATFFANQYSSGSFLCDRLQVRLYDYRTGTYRGVYYNFHAYRYQDLIRQLWATNQWYWNSWPIGYTTQDSGCPWDGYHDHQSMPVQGVASGPNGNRYSDSDGKVWHLNDWIHGWIFWTWTYLP